MFDNFEMILVKIEGLGPLPDSKCHITIDNKTFETIDLNTLEIKQNPLILPQKGELRLNVESNTVLASLRFNLRIIKCQGYHWLPLFKIPQDSIFEVPEEVGLPRVLIIFQSRKFLQPVIEITENSEISENTEVIEIQDFSSEEIELKLRKQIFELEQNLRLEKENKAQSFEKMQKKCKSAKERILFETEKYKENTKRLNKELDEKNKKIQEINDEKSYLASEFELLKAKYAEVVTEKESLCDLLKVKDQELSILKNKVCKKKELSIKQVESIGIARKVKKTKLKLLNTSVENINPEIKEKICLDDSNLVEFHLQQSLIALKLDGFFERAPEHYYKVGHKTVAVLCKNENIYCKVGDSFKTLESYIFTHCSSELENYLKKRVKSTPCHKKTNTMSYFYDKPTTLNKSYRIENENSLRSIRNKSITPCLASKARIKRN